MKRQYFSLVQVGQTATLNIYGDIASWGDDVVSAKNLSKQLDEMQNVSQIDVYINSYGGEVAEGLAIYNALKRKGQTAKVTTYCDGFACSIASVVFMAGNERKMSKSSLLMVHNAWTMGVGNAAELRKIADDMDIITSASVEAYKQVASISEKRIRELMDNETWIKPKDAVKYGFATEIIEENTVNASQNARMRLFDIIMAAENAPKGDDEEEEEKDTPETENEPEGENNDNNDDKKPDENSEDKEKSAENEDEQPENEDEKPEDETEDDEQEKPTEKLGGFFNAIFKF